MHLGRGWEESHLNGTGIPVIMFGREVQGGGGGVNMVSLRIAHEEHCHAVLAV